MVQFQEVIFKQQYAFHLYLNHFSAFMYFGRNILNNMLHIAVTVNIFLQIGHFLSAHRHDEKERTVMYLIFTHLSYTFSLRHSLVNLLELLILHSPSLCSARAAVSPLSARVCYCELGERKISDRANRWLTASCVSAGGLVDKFCPFQKMCTFVWTTPALSLWLLLGLT